MVFVSIIASVAVRLAPMTEPIVAPDATALARWEFDAAPTLVDWRRPAPYPPGKGQPGYGWPSRVEDYEVDNALAEKLAEYPGLEAYWFVREPLDCKSAEYGRKAKSYADAIPFLLFRPKPRPCRWWNPFGWFDSGKVPLVVYLPGNGEQGTDLAKQFRQVGVIGRVVGDEFQDDHPAWLLVPMPPVNANCGIPSGYPVQPRAPLITLYDDLVLKVVEMSRAEGATAPPVDDRRIYLTGLGSGGGDGDCDVARPSGALCRHRRHLGDPAPSASAASQRPRKLVVRIRGEAACRQTGAVQGFLQKILGQVPRGRRAFWRFVHVSDIFQRRPRLVVGRHVGVRRILEMVF